MDAIITVDEDQRVVLFNEAAERMFGCPAAEALGQPFNRFIPERFRGAHTELVRRFGETAGAVLKKVRALEAERGAATDRIPAIALTAYGRSEDRLRALQSGFHMHVAKPVEPAELAVVIASLETRRAW